MTFLLGTTGRVEPAGLIVSTAEELRRVRQLESRRGAANDQLRQFLQSRKSSR